MVKDLVKDLEEFGVQSELVQPGNEQLGSDLAMPCFSLARELKKTPQAIAEEVAKKIKHKDIKKSEAVAGYVNIWLVDEKLFDLASHAAQFEQTHDGKTIICEYSDPNPFKVLHAGHLYDSIIGESLAKMYELHGATVYRVNFGGDVGMHVAKAMWGILNKIEDNIEKLSEVPEGSRADWMADRYVEGNKAFEESEELKSDIKLVNKKVYQVHSDNDRESYFARVYWMCREWSYDYFNKFYKRVGTKFDKYYPESMTAPIGLTKVKEQQGRGVYVESDGAVIFEGEKYGLHNRVFINSEGLPTYEAKDVGLAFAKKKDHDFDETIISTGNDITEYMKVVLKSIEQYDPELVKRTTHITHGMVKLTGA